MSESPAGPYTLYYLGFGEDQRPVYVGITRTSIRRRLRNHINHARSPAGRVGNPIATRIHQEEKRGKGVWLKALMEGLTEDAAKEQEVKVIRGLLRSGIALENRNLRDQYGPANRHPHGSAEFNAASLARHHGLHANDPTYRMRCIAKSALWELKQSRPVTPRRVEVITQAGRADDAWMVLRAQGRESEWLEVDQV